MISKQIGRYLVKSEIGHGGMATVYLAHDPRFQRDVAVKVLAIQFLDNPNFRARFKREAQTIASIEHPAIVPVYDFGEEDGQPYLVMRYMPGGTLSDRLKHGPLNFVEAAKVLTRLAPALDVVHGNGIVHRDLKPGNILFDQYGNAYLSDFGIARLTQATVTLTGNAIIGTPSYMSPEQVRGDPNIDGRCDIYALGVILFEMLTGKHPYEATTPMGVAMKQMTDPVPHIRAIKADLPPEIQEVIDKAMAKEREKRFAMASEMAALQELIGSRLEIQDTTVMDIQPPADSLYQELPATTLPEPVDQAPKPPAKAAASRPDALAGANAGAVISAPPILRPTPGEARPSPVKKKPAAGEEARKPRAGLPLAWILGGLAIAGVCGLIGLAMAGGLTILPGLMSKNKGTPTVPAVMVSSEAAPSPTASEELAAIVTLPPAATQAISPDLFKDDFSDPASGWFTGEELGSHIFYDQGGYRILVDQPNIIAWATPGLHFTDVSIEVDATKVAGADDNLFGILCRYQDEKNFYMLVIGSDGYYLVGKYQDGVSTTIKETAGFSNAIHKGRTSNRIRADCIGNSLTLYVNNLRVVKVADDDFAAGDIGLTAAAYKIGNTNILFDNFIARKP